MNYYEYHHLEDIKEYYTKLQMDIIAVRAHYIQEIQAKNIPLSFARVVAMQRQAQFMRTFWEVIEGGYEQ